MTTSLGLPATIKACLFDLDGVLTPTALVHKAAWKELFDGFLKSQRTQHHGDGPDDPYRPFDAASDYERYVDGLPRDDGVRAFLRSRGIELPTAEVVELSQRKDALFMQRLERTGVEPYEGSLRYLRAAREAGLRRAVVSASTHCEDIVAAAGIGEFLEERVDGVVARTMGLRGKPAPDPFLEAATRLGIAPSAAAVFEDALAGVAAGRAGDFGYVVGVDRVGQADALAKAGADVVITDLAELMDGNPHHAA